MQAQEALNEDALVDGQPSEVEDDLQLFLTQFFVAIP